MSDVTPVLVELDSRRRLSLARVGRHSRYLAREEPDGTLILEPAVVLTATEAALVGRPELVEQMADAAHSERRRKR